MVSATDFRGPTIWFALALGVSIGILTALIGPMVLAGVAAILGLVLLARLAGSPGSLVLLLFSLLLGRVSTINVAGRNPDLLYGDLVAVLLLLFFVAKTLFLPSQRRIGMVIPRGVPILLLVAIVSTWLGVTDPLKGLALFKSLVLGFAVLAYSSAIIKKPQDLRVLLRALLTFGFVLAIMVFASAWFNGGSLAAVGDNKNLVQMAMGKNNYLASFLALLIPLGFFFYISSPLRRWGSLVATISMMGALLVTQSRGALLACTAALFGVALLDGTHRKVVLGVIGVTTLASLVALLLPREILIGMLDRFSPSRFMDSGNRLRVIMWVSALKVFWERPLIGMGLGSTGIYLWDKVGIQYFSSAKTITSPHNFLLESLAETGIVGTIALLWVLWDVFRRLFTLRSISTDAQVRMQLTGVLAALIAGLLHGLVEPLFRASEFAMVYWMMAGAIFGVTPSEAGVGDLLQVAIAQHRQVRSGRNGGAKLES